MIDIQKGDFLVVNGVEYPIRDAGRWKRDFPPTSFMKLANVIANTKRNPPIVDGKRGDAVINIEGLSCTPLDSVSADQVRYRNDLKNPYKVFETFVSGKDEFIHLLVEDVR